MCRIELSFNAQIKDVNLPRSRILWTAVLFMFAGWVTTIGSLATLQEACIETAADGNGGYNGVRGFSSSILTCTKVYRYYWFIVGFEIVLILATALAHSLNKFRKYRFALIGLFIVATLLYIEMTDSFLTGTQKSRYAVDELQDRANAMVAGCIINSVANFYFLLVAGWEDEAAKAL